MAIRKMTVKAGQKPTEGQRQRIREAMKRPIVYDDDSPELTEEQYKAFAVVAEEQRRARRKEIVAIRLSHDTLEKAKMLGRGYTGVLSRLLTMALDNPDMVRKCL